MRTTFAKARGLVALTVLLVVQVAASETYQEPADFIDEAFSYATPEAGALWITQELIGPLEDILGHPIAFRRIRFWGQGGRTAWILEEIGKEQPITTGIVIDDGRIERVKVLVFRESRGWEVRHDFFTNQFQQASLEKDLGLDRHIDGISGATLSVRARKKQARAALFLSQQVVVDASP
ncbi:MAG: FMN-binding protein [Gammaproteobacteria bacterium]